MVLFTKSEGDWLYASKPALKVGMTPRFDLKTKVWCCGMLGAHGYKGELSVTMFRGEQVPLTPALMALQIQKAAVAYYSEAGRELREDEKKALRPGRQEMRRVIVALEDAGIAERRLLEDVVINDYIFPLGTRVRDLSTGTSKRLRSAKVGLYFFLVPRPASNRLRNPGQVVQSGCFSFAGCSAQDSAQICRIFTKYKQDLPNFADLRARLKRVGSNGYVGSAAQEAIKAYLQAEEVVAKAWRTGLK
jgi:hypothetical protein